MAEPFAEQVAEPDRLTVDGPVGPTPSETDPGAGRVSLADRFCDMRNRLIAQPWFQKWSAEFPLTRGIARRKARDLFRITAGFVQTQILVACVEFDLFEILAHEPRTLAQLAHRCGLAEADMARLLRGAVALDLLRQRSDGRYGLGQLGAAIIGNPGIPDMVRHNRAFYADLRDPVALLRGGAMSGAVAALWPYASRGVPADLSTAETATYSHVMATSQAMLAEDILDAYPFARHRKLLDVGGGTGAFLLDVARGLPTLHLTLFDLPSVADQARAALAKDPLGARIAVTGGDFLSGTLPQGADLVSLVRIILDHPDDDVSRLLSAIRAAIAPDGVLLIAEPVSGAAGAELMSDVYFPFYLKAMGGGNTRSLAQHAALLEHAGFTDIRALPTRRPLLTSLVTARPAK